MQKIFYTKYPSTLGLGDVPWGWRMFPDFIVRPLPGEHTLHMPLFHITQKWWIPPPFLIEPNLYLLNTIKSKEFKELFIQTAFVFFWKPRAEKHKSWQLWGNWRPVSAKNQTYISRDYRDPQPLDPQIWRGFQESSWNFINPPSDWLLCRNHVSKQWALLSEFGQNCLVGPNFKFLLGSFHTFDGLVSSYLSSFNFTYFLLSLWQFRGVCSRPACLLLHSSGVLDAKDNSNTSFWERTGLQNDFFFLLGIHFSNFLPPIKMALRFCLKYLLKWMISHPVLK